MAVAIRGLQRCYYAVLGVERTATADEIRSAYRRLALKCHPDRNPDNVEEATSLFQELQSAYAVLSDPHERQWYDDHRESILRGAGEGGDEDDGHTLNLWPYFQSSCFKGFSDRAGSFYAVYSHLFSEIAAQESAGGDAAFIAPSFGDSRSGWPSVAEFYRFWSNFTTTRTFAWKDQYRAGPDTPRQERRLMDKFNAKARETGRREYNSQVRQLVAYIKKLDPRVSAHEAEVARVASERAARLRAEREAAAAAQRDAERQRATEAEALAAEHAARVDRMLAEQGWLSGGSDDGIDSERDGDVGADAAAAAAAAADAGSDDAAGPRLADELYCEACRKAFKSGNQLASHQRSKKHTQRVAELRAQLLAEDAAVETARAAAAAAAAMHDPPAPLPRRKEPPARPEPRPPGAGTAAEPASASDGEQADAAEVAARLARLWTGPAAAAADGDSGSEESAREAGAARSGPVAAAGADSGDEGEGTAARHRRRRKARPTPAAGSGAGKSALRTAAGKPAAGSASAAAAAGGGGGAVPDADRVCSVCRAVFETRNKLFKHIKETGHALNPAYAAAAAAARGSSGAGGSSKRRGQ